VIRWDAAPPEREREREKKMVHDVRPRQRRPCVSFTAIPRRVMSFFSLPACSTAAFSSSGPAVTCRSRADTDPLDAGRLPAAL